ncbi:MAG: NAD(P)-dependent oxidoreductase [Saprospiraceae bacterium]
MKVTSILITDYVHEFLIENLINDGFKVDYFPDITLVEVKEIINNYEGIVINTKIPIDKEMMDLGARLKVIVRLGSGLEIVDLNYAKEKGIIVKNTPEGNRNAVGEHALGMLLALMNNIVIANNEVKEFNWEREKNRGNELEGKTIGIIGFGNTGSAFAKLLSGFDIKILAYDKYKQRFASEFRNTIETDLKEIFEESDIVSFHVPLTKETYHMGNTDFFKSFNKDVFVINTSRGKVIKTEDLIENLSTKKIKGAAIDVFENEHPSTYTDDEKLMYSNLLSMENVVATPHIAGWTKESKFKIGKLTYTSLIGVLKV